jgi:hypothetical protein
MLAASSFSRHARKHAARRVFLSGRTVQGGVVKTRMARDPSRKRSHAVIDQVEGSCGERAGRSKPRAPMETLGDALVTTWAVPDSQIPSSSTSPLLASLCARYRQLDGGRKGTVDAAEKAA